MRILPICLAAAASLVLAQSPQNPSPMVEHTRTHPRLTEEVPPGLREPLEAASLYVPEPLRRKPALPLLVFFHGGAKVPELAAARNHMAAVTAQLGSGSGVYARAFADPQRFPALVAEAEKKAGIRFTRVVLGGWSAGCGAVREIIKSRESYDRVSAFVLIDGIHAGYVKGKPGPLESEIDTAPLEIWLQLARDAMAGRKRVLITHSEIFPGTFASTTETPDYIVRQLGLRRRPVLKWGPMGTQQLSEVRSGRLLLIGSAGNSAPDHVDQLHSLPVYVRHLR